MIGPVIATGKSIPPVGKFPFEALVLFRVIDNGERGSDPDQMTGLHLLPTQSLGKKFGSVINCLQSP